MTAPVVSECGIPCLAYTQEYPIPAHSSHQEPRRPKPPGNLRNLQENLSRNSKERIVSRYTIQSQRGSLGGAPSGLTKIFSPRDLSIIKYSACLPVTLLS